MATILPSYADKGADRAIPALQNYWNNKARWKENLLNRAADYDRLRVQVKDPIMSDYYGHLASILRSGTGGFVNETGDWYAGHNPLAGGRESFEQFDAPKDMPESAMNYVIRNADAFRKGRMNFNGAPTGTKEWMKNRYPSYNTKVRIVGLSNLFNPKGGSGNPRGGGNWWGNLEGIRGITNTSGAWDEEQIRNKYNNFF